MGRAMNEPRNKPGDGLALAVFLLGLIVIAVAVVQVGLAVSHAR